MGVNAFRPDDAYVNEEHACHDLRRNDQLLDRLILSRDPHPPWPSAANLTAFVRGLQLHSALFQVVQHKGDV